MSIWQNASWGEMLIKSGQAEKIFNIDGIQIEKRKVSAGEYGLFVLGVENKISEEVLNELSELCKKESCLFIQIETINYNNELNKIENNFSLGYYKKFITPYTAVINLEKSEEDILKEMKPKGRYNIKLATKKGIIVKEVLKTKENIEKFYELMLETTSRDNFSGNKIEFYEDFLNKLNNTSLLLAYKDEIVISAGIFVFDKDVSIYYYGASTSDKKYRNLMAPYLLQWEAIKIAKSQGSLLYDFLGVSSPDSNDKSLSGVTDFKLKLTKDVRNVSSSYIYINKKLKYYLIELLRKLKK